MARITIDNSHVDWEDVLVFLACGTREIKLARDKAGRNLHLTSTFVMNSRLL